MHKIESSLLELYQSTNLQKLTPNSNTLFIAYSGGLDSTVLLYASKQLVSRQHISNIKALHVNHGIEKNSDSWQSHCVNICGQLSIELTCEKLNIAKTASNVNENLARNKRYHFFQSQLNKNDQIAFAHHQDDQIETLLFRLFRGTGISGARSIPKSRNLGKAVLIRPFLKHTKEELLNYAQENNLSWIEDQSNAENKYSRNIIRNKIVPLIKNYWPKVNQSLQSFIQIAGEQNTILQEVAETDLNNLIVDSSRTIICLNKFILLSKERKKNVLHYWVLQSKLNSFSRPTAQEINELVFQIDCVIKSENKHELNAAKINVKLGENRVRLFDEKLWLCNEIEPKRLVSDTIWDLITEPFEISKECSMIAQDVNSRSNSDALIVRAPMEDEILSVRVRKGGERITPSYRNKSCDFKKMFQELKIPHWKREWLPIIYYNDEIVCIPQVFVNKKYIPIKEEKMIVFLIDTF